jgi:hypothetical protein
MRRKLRNPTPTSPKPKFASSFLREPNVKHKPSLHLSFTGISAEALDATKRLLNRQFINHQEGLYV